MAESAVDSRTIVVNPDVQNMEKETNAKDFKSKDNQTGNLKTEKRDKLKSTTQQNISEQDNVKDCPVRKENNENHNTSQEDSKVHVCHSCQHLYGKNSEIVIIPSNLNHTHDHVQHHSAFKPWKARKYEDLCACPESGREDQGNSTEHQTSVWQNLIPRNAPWWPRTKIILLVIAGILPWVFLVIYLVFTYKTSS
ncbi:hypothetical protein OTU49_008356 [Cherax quadricarinatus]|uniref:Uncharacterized protein n=1 Tax=Cherax quadricarinatus TaxID=27406 RepID=A0AAW0WPM8_CHEQU|nr:uncharacterized protein LOC128704118 [Cherax quadricarinatus]